MASGRGKRSCEFTTPRALARGGNGGHPPSIVAGHSLGEYAALVTAGALVFSDAVSLVQKRSTLMQNAVPPGIGAMAAVLGLSDEDIQTACERAKVQNGGVAEAANYNAPGQVVIAGDKATVEKAIDEAKTLEWAERHHKSNCWQEQSTPTSEVKNHVFGNTQCIQY